MFEISKNVDKLFPHPVGIFFTLLEPPVCCIMQKYYNVIDFPDFTLFPKICPINSRSTAPVDFMVLKYSEMRVLGTHVFFV